MGILKVAGSNVRFDLLHTCSSSSKATLNNFKVLQSKFSAMLGLGLGLIISDRTQ